MKQRPLLAVLVVAAALAVLFSASMPVADDATVVVTRPGTVFHMAGSEDLRGRGHARTLESAINAGYAPCTVCFREAGTSGLATASRAAGAVSSPSGRGVLAPPHGQASVTQPFGLKQVGHPHGGGDRDAVRNPYVDPTTVRNPGPEQGAFGE